MTYRHKIEGYFLEVVKYQTTHFNRHGDGCKVIIEQDECSLSSSVGSTKGCRRRSTKLTSFLRNIASASHGDTDVRGPERRRIINTVAGNCNGVVPAMFDVFDNGHLLVRSRAREHDFSVRPNDHVPVFRRKGGDIFTSKNEGADRIINGGLDQRRADLLGIACRTNVLDGIDPFLRDNTDLTPAAQQGHRAYSELRTNLRCDGHGSQFEITGDHKYPDTRVPNDVNGRRDIGPRWVTDADQSDQRQVLHLTVHDLFQITRRKVALERIESFAASMLFFSKRDVPAPKRLDLQCKDTLTLVRPCALQHGKLFPG